MFKKLLTEMKELGYGVLAAQMGKYEWGLNTDMMWSTSGILNADEDIMNRFIAVRALTESGG